MCIIIKPNLENVMIFPARGGCIIWWSYGLGGYEDVICTDNTFIMFISERRCWYTKSLSLVTKTT